MEIFNTSWLLLTRDTATGTTVVLVEQKETDPDNQAEDKQTFRLKTNRRHTFSTLNEGARSLHSQWWFVKDDIHTKNNDKEICFGCCIKIYSHVWATNVRMRNLGKGHVYYADQLQTAYCIVHPPLYSRFVVLIIWLM